MFSLQGLWVFGLHVLFWEGCFLLRGYAGVFWVMVLLSPIVLGWSGAGCVWEGAYDRTGLLQVITLVILVSYRAMHGYLGMDKYINHIFIFT